MPSSPLRKECPPGACECERDRLLADPDADLRILWLTKEEEKKLVQRLESVSSYTDLKAMQARMQAQLGISLQIVPSVRGVRTLRGIGIQLQARPGLCKKTRQTIPAAIRRCLETHPEIAFAILNADSLFDDDANAESIAPADAPAQERDATQTLLPKAGD